MHCYKTFTVPDCAILSVIKPLTVQDSEAGEGDHYFQYFIKPTLTNYMKIN